jgi:exodeoxyribonuclease VII large subunit
VGRRQQRVDELGFRMESAWRALFHERKQRLESLATAISRNDAAQRIRFFRERLENFSSRLLRAQALANQNRRAALQSLERQLAALSPLAVLNRGYALVYSESGALLTRASDARPGELLSTRLASGGVESRITRITPENAGPEKA